eukprot:13076320-Alexandrium_andersonii.AAC.1
MLRRRAMAHTEDRADHVLSGARTARTATADRCASGERKPIADSNRANDKPDKPLRTARTSNRSKSQAATPEPQTAADRLELRLI